MKTLKNVGLGLLLNSLLLTACAHSRGPANFENLNYSDFDQVGNANWTSQDEALIANTGNGFLVTKESYEDFHLKLEFKAEGGTNSGIFFRCNNDKIINDQKCYEANIFDSRPDQKYRTGGITHYTSPKSILKTEDGKWHSYEVITKGSSIRIILDGQETVMTRNEKLARGPIALQFAMGGIQFRKIKVSELDEEVTRKAPIDGVWELESFTLTNAEGTVNQWCEGSYGVIIYTQGYMSTAVNCTSDAKKVLLYSGAFEYKNNEVTHFATNYSDLSLKRAFQRSVVMTDENRLELNGELPGGVTASVKWVRR
jgi:hypothetical protein